MLYGVCTYSNLCDCFQSKFNKLYDVIYSKKANIFHFSWNWDGFIHDHNERTTFSTIHPTFVYKKYEDFTSRSIISNVHTHAEPHSVGWNTNDCSQRRKLKDKQQKGITSILSGTFMK